MARYAVKTPTQHTKWEDMLAVWREADQIELFESAWTWDHLYPLLGDPNGTSLEGWVTLAALAQATEKIGVGCMVRPAGSTARPRPTGSSWARSRSGSTDSKRVSR